MTTRFCKDCARDGVTSTRPAPHAGPRCATHHRAFTREQMARAHDRVVGIKYGLGPGNYQILLAIQEGKCAGCRRATGKAKRLAVDHNHDTGEVRGLLCGPCNSTLAHFRDDPVALRRMADYLENPPARKLNQQRGTKEVPFEKEES